MLSNGNSLVLPGLSSGQEGLAEQRLGKYTVLERLGAGGMAEVFKCRPSGLGALGKVVVVKRILTQHLGNSEFIQMFLDEARIAAHLNHPNVVHTYEIDEVEGIPQIVMEYVHGVTFGDLIRAAAGGDMRQWWPVAAKVMAGVCRGLHAAHAATDADGSLLQLIHRDVTPHNILVSVDGIPKLADFGVVQANGQLAASQTGTLKGKFKYMAPEQFQRGVEIDRRVDIFSAGVCLYLATTGRLPYDGETDLEVIAAASAGRYPKPSARVPNFPLELEETILWAMAPNREARCPDGRTLATALEAFVAAGPPAVELCTAKTVGQKVKVAKIAANALNRPSRKAASVESGGFLRGSFRDLGLEMAVRALSETDTRRPYLKARLKQLAPSLAWLALAAIAMASYLAQ